MNSNSTKFYSNKQESQIADALGWEVVSGSGAAPCAPGDVIGENWLGECKTHTSNAKSIYFNHDVWEKIKEEAVVKHRKPVLFTDDGSQSLDSTWCVCFSHSVDTASVYVLPLNINVKKNISFDHLELNASYRSSRRVMPELFRTKVLVYETSWQGDSVYVIPFNAFKQLCEEQG